MSYDAADHWPDDAVGEIERLEERIAELESKDTPTGPAVVEMRLTKDEADALYALLDRQLAGEMDMHALQMYEQALGKMGEW